MNKAEFNLLQWYANELPKGDSERVAILHHLKTAKTFEETVEGKTFTHPKTKEKVKFKSLPPEEQKKIREQNKDKDKGDDKKESPKGIKERVTGWIAKAKNLSKKGKETLLSLPENSQKFVADKEYRKEIKEKSTQLLKAEGDKFFDKAKKSLTTQFTDVSDGVQSIMSGKPPTAGQVKATIKLGLKMSAAAGVAALAGGVGTAAGATAGGGALVTSLFINSIAKVFSDYTDLEVKMKEFITQNLPDAETMEKKYKNINDWLKQAQASMEEIGIDIGAEELIEGTISIVTASEVKQSADDKDTKEFMLIISKMMLEMVNTNKMSEELITKTLNDMPKQPSAKKVAERYLTSTRL